MPYDKIVDIWSIGIITYLLLTGYLPYDDPNSEREVIRQTLNDPVPFHSEIWKKISFDAKNFIEKCLTKNPYHRIKIKDLLEHSWFQKYNKNKLSDLRKKMRSKNGSLFEIYSTCDENSSGNIGNILK